MSLKDNCMDFGPYPEVFDKNALPCMGLSIPDRPDLKVVAPRDFNVRITLNTYRGISYGALHYYGMINAQQPYITDGECGVGGYISDGWRAMPREITKMIGGYYEIEIIRKLTQDEIDNNPVRWEGYEAGATTNSFEKREQVLALAIGIVKWRFPGWQVMINDNTK